MQVPKDQELFLTIFLALSLTVIAAFWLWLPLHHVVVRDEDEGGDKTQTTEFKLPPVVTPEERVMRMEKALAMASAVITKVEGSDKEKEGEKGGGKPGEKSTGKSPAKSDTKSDAKTGAKPDAKAGQEAAAKPAAPVAKGK
jgi:hypothetical protein